MDNVVKVLYYDTCWYNQGYSSKSRSRRLLQSGLMGLCVCHLQEKLKCSNGIHDGKSWHGVCINISRERQKICRIVAIKISGKILCSGELARRSVLSMEGIPSKLGHDWWNETLTRDMNLKTFHNICSEATWVLLLMSRYCSRKRLGTVCVLKFRSA